MLEFIAVVGGLILVFVIAFCCKPMRMILKHDRSGALGTKYY